MLVFKKGEMEDPRSYRPVSLTSVPGKIVEHALLKYISKHVKDKKVIRNSQHRLTKGKSCLTNLMAFCRKIIGDVDREGAIILINIDFSETFDTVPHRTLLCKLSRCEQDKWATRNLAGLAGMEDSDQRLDVWLEGGDEKSSLVLCTTTLESMLFIVLISHLDGDTQKHSQ